MINKILKKLLVLTMAITTFISLFGGIGIKAAADVTVTAGTSTGYSVNVSNPDGHSEWNANYSTILIDGETGFCIQPGYVLAEGPGFVPTVYQRDEISIIAYEGWLNSSRTNEDYLATQFMIWESLGGTIVSTSFSAYGTYKTNIQNKVNRHFTKPSFKVGDYTVNVGEIITLEDTNNVLNDFNIVSTDGLNVSKNGNKLSITATNTSKDNSVISLQKINDIYVRTSLAYTKPGSQSVAKLYVGDPIPVNITIKVNKFGSLSITKQDDLGNNVPNTSFKLSKNADMSSPIGTYTTGANGIVVVDQLLPSTYYVQEVSVPGHLILDSTIRSIEVQANQTSSYTATNKWKRGKIEITKRDDLGNHVANTSFKLSKSADMSNPIGTYKTGTNGVVVVNDLLPSTYYVQEVSVPDHLMLDSTIRSIVVKGDGTSSYTATNKWKRGYIQVVKKDIDTGKVITKSNATFSVYKSDDTFVKDITTNNKGIAKTGLELWGDYYLVEKLAPNGYTHSKQKLVYQIREDGKTYSQDISNKRVTGTINLTKEDSITGNKPQGDATLEGAVYELKARTPILDPADGSVKYAKDSVVATLTTDKNAEASKSDLYLGGYYLKEKTPSYGYTLDPTEYDVTLSYANQNTSVITKSQTVKEKVIDGDFKITKVIEVDPNNSEITKPEKDAEFVVVLKKYVDKYGSVEEAYKHKGEFADKEYDLLITDKDGEDISKKLAYGTYLAQQTKVGDENVDLLEKPFEVKIENENQTTIKYVISNQKFLSYLQLEKKDAETGKTVTLSNTSFKVYDVDNDKYLSQRVGLIRHDTWTTDETGKVTLPLKVPAGKYRLEEIKAPDGYLLKTDKIDFVMKESNVSIVDDENEPIQIVVFSNSKPTGSTKLIKSDEDSGETLSGVQYRLTAAEDVLDPADGSIIYKKGSPVSMDIAEDGYYMTNELGEIEVDGLSLGSYAWEETKALDGYVQDTNKYTFELKQKNDTQKVYTHKQELINQKTKIEILKENVNNDALEGAKLRLIDEDKNVVKEWISKKGSLKLEGLLVGKEYTLYEDEAPEGYVISKQVKFAVKNTTEIQEIKMIDIQIPALKTDVDGEVLSGAKMQVLSAKTKNIVDQWTSTEKAHHISNIIEGQEYILREVQAPKGYVLAKDIKFIANDKKEQQSISMIDKQIFVDKVDNENKNIKGASLQVIDQDNNIVDEWISSDKEHSISNLIVGDEYTLQEVEAPKGYVLAKDVKFTVTDKNDIQKVTMIDKQVTALKIDEDGKVLPGAKLQVISTKTKDIVDQWTSTEKEHSISNLIEGNSYILREVQAPKGYVLAQDIKFVANDKKEQQSISMTDKQVTALKIDEDGKVLPGAKLQVVSTKTKKIVDQWTTTNEVHYISNLIEGNSYILRELEAPEGLLLADDIEFTVNAKKDTQALEMVDEYILTKIQVNKIDSYTKEAIKSKDFLFTAYKNKNCKEAFVTVSADTKEGTATFDLRYGEWWIKETKAPTGYLLSDEVKHIVINKEGVFVNDKKIDAEDSIHSFVYENQQLPTIKTGDNTEINRWISIVGASIFGGGILFYKKRNSLKDKKQP